MTEQNADGGTDQSVQAYANTRHEKDRLQQDNMELVK